MAFVELECKICFEDYDSENHRPLSLDCGHTYCKLCIESIGHGNSKICPTCKKLTNKSTDQLPVIYALIPSEESTTTRSNVIDVVGDKCNDHGSVLDRFCAECGEMVCRKCVENSHAAHRHELMDAILRRDPVAAATTGELKNKIEANIDSLSKLLSVPIEISEIIDYLSSYKNGIEDWKDRLFSQKKLAEQDLKDWNDASFKCTNEKYELFKKLCHQWRGVSLPPGLVSELTLLTEKLEDIDKFCALLQGLMEETKDDSKRKILLNGSENFPDGGIWRVENDEHSQVAISSVRAGKIPSHLEIVSSPTAPILNLTEVLNVVGSACADGSVSVKLLDTFWAPSSTTNLRNLEEFFKKHDRKMEEFYGSSDEVVTLCRLNPLLRYAGVRLASMADVNLCLTLPEKPRTVCCTQSLPAAAGARMLQLGWKPLKWHFPDSKAASGPWMISLMTADLYENYSRCLNIFLPRCLLSKNDFCLLLKTRYQCRKIYCEHLSLSASDKSDLESIAKKSPCEIFFLDSISL